MHSTYIHTSEFETVGLPIYEALESGLKVVVPNLDYLNLKTKIYLNMNLEIIHLQLKHVMNSIKNLDKIYCNVPIYYENWNLD